MKKIIMVIFAVFLSDVCLADNIRVRWSYDQEREPQISGFAIYLSYINSAGVRIMTRAGAVGPDEREYDAVGVTVGKDTFVYVLANSYYNYGPRLVSKPFPYLKVVAPAVTAAVEIP